MTLLPKHLSLLFALAIASAVVGCDTGGGESTYSVRPRHRSTPALRTYASCADLEVSLKASLSEQSRVQLLQLNEDGYWRGMPPMAAEGDAAVSGAGQNAADTRQEGVDFSGTNNQEGGVDEADFLKTDGYYIYLLNGPRLEIFAVPEFGELVSTSQIDVEGYPSQMLLGADRIAVFSQVYTYNLPVEHPLRAALVGSNVQGYDSYWAYPSLTKLTVIDVSDRSAPSVAREIYLEGYYQTAREVDGTVRLISYSWMDVPGLLSWPELPENYYQLSESAQQQVWQQRVFAAIDHNEAVIATLTLDDLLPVIAENTTGGVAVHPFTEGGCGNFSAAEDALSRGLTSILSIDLDSPELAFEADHLVSNWATIYASQDALVIAEMSWDWWWFWGQDDAVETTNLHLFDISNPGATSYVASGRIDGTINDQFAISEKDGFLRVATTTDRFGAWWLETPPVAENHVFTLLPTGPEGAAADALTVIGHLGGIALGERIWSSRFVGDKAYLVTFRNIDPLWTIDLTDPVAPSIAGELEVPGVSTYIHPVQDSRLLTIGYGGDGAGLDWTAQLSLFDVSNFSQPTLQSSFSLAPAVDPNLGWSWAFSEATYEHKAFQYWEPKKLLAIPVSTYRSFYDNSWGYYGYEYYSRLQLVNVDSTTGLSAYGSVDHSAFFNNEPQYWWGAPDIRRSIFMGEFVYAISSRAITAHHLADLSLSASVQLEGAAYCGMYYCGY